MKEIVAADEMEALRPERVWQETVKALATERPDVFVETLRACGALARIFPEVDALFGVPQPEQWHPEIDSGVHTLMALRMAAQLSRSETMRFAVLVHDFGQRRDARRAAAATSWARAALRGADRAAVCALARAESVSAISRCIVARHHGTVHRAA